MGTATALRTWNTPASYFGFNPVGDYVVLTKNRDSGLLDQSNWDVAVKRLNAIEDKTENPDASVYTWVANHWACGWVEYLMVSKDAPIDIIAIAENICSEIEAYPVLDENDYSNRQSDAVSEYWASLSISERVELCQENNDCVFAARRSYPPAHTADALYSSEITA